MSITAQVLLLELTLAMKFRTEKHLVVGALLFPGLDQADLTGPFEVLSRLSDSEFHIVAKEKSPIRDVKNLLLTPDETLAAAPQFDLLLVPGGAGVNEVMEEEVILSFIRKQARGAKLMMSVCTGALIYGAAGLLRRRKATTHWASHHLLPRFGAIAVNERVVMDGKLLTTSGVTAGYDGALRAVALLRGRRAAEAIQLYIQYAPEPPFASGNPETAPPGLVAKIKKQMAPLLRERVKILRRIAR